MHDPEVIRGNTMSSYAIRRRGLQEEIQNIVKRYIIDHRFRPGDALPGEGELARQMGISRPSLREAMKVLQTIGVIETRHGSGTYVGSLSLDPFADGMAFQILIAAQHDLGPPRDLLDIIEIREVIETTKVRQVIGRHSESQLKHLNRLCDEMEMLEVGGGAFGELDLQFHRALYEPLKSHVYDEFIKAFWKISNLTIRPYADQFHRDSNVEHRSIIKAIVAQDSRGAGDAMSAHILNIGNDLRKGFDAQRLREEALREDEET